MHGQIREYNIITASRQTNVNGNITTHLLCTTCPEKKPGCSCQAYTPNGNNQNHLC